MTNTRRLLLIETREGELGRERETEKLTRPDSQKDFYGQVAELAFPLTPIYLIITIVGQTIRT